jgi:hypothetical protein
MKYHQFDDSNKHMKMQRRIHGFQLFGPSVVLDATALYSAFTFATACLSVCPPIAARNNHHPFQAFLHSIQPR